MKYRVLVTEKVRHAKEYEVEADTAQQAEEIAVDMAIQDEDGVPFLCVDDRFAEARKA